MQRISVTVTLNRSTLQFDEAAFEQLEQYLAGARRTLEGNPDRDEIVADLEQAIADQCTRRLPAGTTTVTPAELRPALEEIGPVQAPGATASSPGGAARPLQQVSEGAVISGVCQGLARYFGLDVFLLRIAAVILLFATGGGMILVYIAMMLLMPYAPLQRGGKPPRKIPAKSRSMVEFIRAKLGVAAA
jgi:phage shock protein PspC (stress-responsive transcriptional regulator)